MEKHCLHRQFYNISFDWTGGVGCPLPQIVLAFKNNELQSTRRSDN